MRNQSVLFNEVPTFMSLPPRPESKDRYRELYRLWVRRGEPYKHLVPEAKRAQHGVGILPHMRGNRSRLDHSINSAYFVARVTDDSDAVVYAVIHDVSSLPKVPHAGSRLTESQIGMGEREIITLGFYNQGPFKEVEGKSLSELAEYFGAKRKNVVHNIKHPETPLSKTCDGLESTEGSMVDYLFQRDTPPDGGYLSKQARERIFNNTKVLSTGDISLPTATDPDFMKKWLNYRVDCYGDNSVALREGTVISIMKRMLMRADENEDRGVFDEYELPVNDAGAFYRMTDVGFVETVKKFVDAYPEEKHLILRLLSASRFRYSKRINKELGKNGYRIILHPKPTIHLGVDTTGHGKNSESVNLVNHFLRGTEYPEMVKADTIIREQTNHDGIVVPIIGQSAQLDNMYMEDRPLGDPEFFPQTVCAIAAVLPTRSSPRYVPVEESRRVLDNTLNQIPALAAYMRGIQEKIL